MTNVPNPNKITSSATPPNEFSTTQPRSKFHIKSNQIKSKEKKSLIYTIYKELK